MKPFHKKNLAVLAIMLVLLLSGSRLKAQKAPDFSNDLMMDNKTYVFFMADRLEFYNIDGKPVIFDAQGYIGKNLNKFWFEAEGETLTTETEGEMEFSGLYSRAISAYFDLQTGIRYDIAYAADSNLSRGFAVIGIQGLAPYLFEIDSNLYVSESGDISIDLEAEYDFPITQRLWGQPRFETGVAIQEVPKWGIGNGLNDIQLGFRLRYEIKREFAPYAGISWNRKIGETANFSRTANGDVGTFGIVGGVRMWF